MRIASAGGCRARCRRKGEREGVSRHALEKRSVVSRDMIGDIENGDSIPILHLAAHLAFGLNFPRGC